MYESGISKDGDVFEIVSFKFKEGVPFAEQAQATQSLNCIVAAYNGFKSREFYYCEDSGRWSDFVVWASIEDAKLAAGQIMQNPEAGKAFALMDETTMQFSHSRKLGSFMPK